MTPSYIFTLAILSVPDLARTDQSILFPEQSNSSMSEQSNSSMSYRTPDPLTHSSSSVRLLSVAGVVRSAGQSHDVPSGCSQAEAVEGFCLSPDQYPDMNLLRNLVRNRTSSIEEELLFGEARRQQGRTSAAVPIQPNVPTTRTGFSNASSASIFTYTEEDNLRNSEGELSFVEEVPVCDSMESFVYPRTARNLEKKWRFVINIPRDEAGDEEYVQAVKVERCLRPGRRCNIDSVTGSETVCRQKYTLRRLLALSDNGQQYVDSFKFPSCCVCYLKRSFHLELRDANTRIGSHINTSETEINLRNDNSDGK